METQQLHRGRLIDHLQLVVQDLNASRDFYTAVLAVLDIPVVDTSDNYFWADELVVSSADSPAGPITAHRANGPIIQGTMWLSHLETGAAW